MLDRRIGADAAELTLLVGADCPWFEGHFPGRPILSGVVQIGWAAHFAADIYAVDAAVLSVDRVKFRRIIGPGARLVLRLTPAGAAIRYDYRDGTASCSSGQLNLERRP